jgi:hypothetical protein
MPKRKKAEKQGFIYHEAAHGPFITFTHPNKKVVPLGSPFPWLPTQQRCGDININLNHYHNP